MFVYEPSMPSGSAQADESVRAAPEGTLKTDEPLQPA
jgi:hypothetical protein